VDRLEQCQSFARAALLRQEFGQVDRDAQLEAAGLEFAGAL
jgi:hypothetical protein